MSRRGRRAARRTSAIVRCCARRTTGRRGTGEAVATTDIPEVGENLGWAGNPLSPAFVTLWISGSWSMFTAVDWYGDSSQFSTFPFLGLDVACEGGWGINAMYAANPMYYLPVVGFYTSVSNLSREAVIEHPLFTPFSAESEAMHSTNLFTIANSDYRAQLRSKFLGDAIPATSFSAGANSVSTNVVCGNINYRDCQSGEWPRVELEWWHSDIKDMAYFFVFRVFEKIKEEGGLE